MGLVGDNVQSWLSVAFLKDVDRALMEGDMVLSRKRNAIKCLNGSCKWKKSDGLVMVPYSLSNYFCEDLLTF